MTVSSRKWSTAPQLIWSGASLLRAEEEKHRCPHHMPHHIALLPGTALKVSFPRADFLPSSKSKLGLGFWLVLHLPYSSPGPYGMHIGGAWFQSQVDQSKGEVLWRFSRYLGASWDRTVNRRAADSNNACDRRKNREKMTSLWAFHTEEGQNWSWVGWLQSFA